MTVFAQPPLDGTLSVFPGFLDFRAQQNPNDPCYIFASSDSSDIVSVSYLEFFQATHRVANALDPERAVSNGEVVAIVVNCDTLLYEALFLGLTRAGFVPFPMSPRNSAAAIASMCQRSDCHRIVAQPALEALIDETRADLPSSHTLRIDMLPNFFEIFPILGNAVPSAVFAPSLYAPREDLIRSEIVYYLHSSGSTGFPKPIPQRQKTVLQYCTCSLLSSTLKHRLRWGAMPLPPFHTIGVFYQLYSPIVTGFPVALYAPNAPAPPPVPTPENTLEAIQRTGCTGILCMPTFLEAYAQDEESTKFLASLKYVTFAGGPLSRANGDKLAAAGVNLHAMYGMTEAGPVTLLPLENLEEDLSPAAENLSPVDWEWVQIDPQYTLRWSPQGDGTYELQILTTESFMPCVENLPDGLRGYGTSDLCELHPTKPNLWRVVGRTDDVIVLGSGEKTVPLQQEGHIGAHPCVKGAVMFGRGRLQVGVVVEPHPEYAVTPKDTNAMIAFRNLVWAQVEEANHLAPAFSRIFKEMILVTEPSRPLVRSGKGTIIRKGCLALYDDDITKLYDLVESSKDASGVKPPASWTETEVQAWLKEHIALINETVPEPHEDLFEHGFDSLNATFLRNRIIGALRDSPDPDANAVAQHVQPNFIYTHSTLSMLTAAVVQHVHPDEAVASKKTSNEVMKDMIAKYTAKLPSVPETVAARADSRAVVLLTGSTGGLGSHILADLLADERVARVYALNRGKGLAERQKAIFEEACLPVTLLEGEKVVLLSGELTREDFGLDLSVFHEMRASVTHIVHNAWRVDFNLALASFEPQIDATVRLITLVPSARFLFTSSVSVAGNWDASRGRVPEAPLGDPDAVIPGLGYGQSKFVVEEVLAAAHQAGIQAVTLRVGQISGTVASGTWSTTDWVPALVKSSVSLQGLPQLQGLVSWLPSDAVARAVIDTMLTPELPSTVNVSHPRPVPWRVISDAINRALDLNLPSLPMEDWIQKLERVAKDASAVDMDNTPAIKLLGFFRGVAAALEGSKMHEIEVGGLPVFATEKLRDVSMTLAQLPPLDDAHVQAWVGYWRSKEFL